MMRPRARPTGEQGRPDTSTRWKIALLVAACIVFADVRVILFRLEGGDPEGVADNGSVALSVAAVPAMIVAAVALVKLLRRSAAPVLDVGAAGNTAGETVFRPRLPAAFDIIVWLWLPTALLSAAVLARYLDFGVLGGTLLAAFMLSEFPILLGIRGTRYEVTEGALVLRRIRTTTVLPWDAIRAVTGEGRTMRIRRDGGRDVRLAAPEDATGFIEAIRARAPRARTDG